MTTAKPPFSFDSWVTMMTTGAIRKPAIPAR